MQGSIHTLGKYKGKVLPYFMPLGIDEREAKHHIIVLQFGLYKLSKMKLTINRSR